MGMLWSRTFRKAPPTTARAYSESNVKKPACHTPEKPRAASISNIPWKTMKIHKAARYPTYPRSDIKRFPVPDDKVLWSVEMKDYQPVEYTANSVMKQPPWADHEFLKDHDAPVPVWNTVDGILNRKSHEGVYEIVDGLPRNQHGRTGVHGRGLLGRWGPNHAADPIVTRWKKDSDGKVCVDENRKPILQFIAIQRSDNGQWALPGGMVNAGEVVSITLKREFGEEALNSLEASEVERQHIEYSVNKLFNAGVEVYQGYVDDPRNTDNAWMETVAINFHDKDGDGVSMFKLHAGDDAVGVKWIDLSSQLKLYASHIDFLAVVAERHKARW